MKLKGQVNIFLMIFLAGCAISSGALSDSSLGVQNTTKADSFVAFESGQVRPLALSEDGKRLYVVNTPDNRLEIFDATAKTLTLITSVPVGLEPVAIALKGNSQAWVVNHLSDTISIIDLTLDNPSVVDTLLVGDEPRDIVFAGKHKEKAFITCAHRGQNISFDPQLTTPGVGRADLWVFDTERLSKTPNSIINLFSDTPRALAVDASGRLVYAAAFNSGNKTTVLKAEVAAGGLRKPSPDTDMVGAPAPKTGLIVKFNGTDWVDGGGALGEIGKVWTDRVKFNLPDNDVFVIDAFLDEPKQIKSYSGVGTTLFNMAINPANGHVYVSNLEARNEVRFASSGKRSSTLRGHFAENRISVLTENDVVPRHLNSHIKSYDKPIGSPQENINSLALPLEMQVSNDGKTLYVAAFGSAKIGVFNTDEIENGTFSPQQDAFDLSTTINIYNDSWKKACLHYDDGGGKWTNEPGIKMKSLGDGWFSGTLNAKDYSSQIRFVFNNCGDEWDDNFAESYKVFPGNWRVEKGALSGVSRTEKNKKYISVAGGPSGLILDEQRDRLFVYSRFDSIISIIDTKSNAVIQELPLFNPEPKEVREGRPFLYDSNLSSSRGDSSCAACHIFGDVDNLAWDLGDPDNIVTKNPNPYLPVGPLEKKKPYFHPMKGPMTTQSFRGMVNNGPMHWRGDKTTTAGDVGESLEMRAFQEFNVAFVELQGAEKGITNDQMKKFARFSLSLKYPPNPIRNLDQSLTKKQVEGYAQFKDKAAPGLVNCQTCHLIDPKNKIFSTVGLMNLSIPESGRDQDFKIPQLVNNYQKVGMFGDTGAPNNGFKHMGDQVRGFGFNHDGATDTIDSVLSEDIFMFSDDKHKAQQEKDSLSEAVLVMDSEMAPIVGQQVTITSNLLNDKDKNKRVSLLIKRAKVIEPVPECDLVVKGIVNGEPRGAYFDVQADAFQFDRRSEPKLSLAKMWQLAKRPGNTLTFTCVPPGSGVRIGIDRNQDGIYDSDKT